MIPFRVQFQPGASLFDQTVHAAKKAMVVGQFRVGDAFPSVRALSRELKINPNTAHKVVTALIAEGLLVPQPGIGTVVARPPDASGGERAALLGKQVEELIVEAKRLGVKLDALQEAVTLHWTELSGDDSDRKAEAGEEGPDDTNRSSAVCRRDRGPDRSVWAHGRLAGARPRPA